ncbi:DUF5018 domain-containing protein [Ichthyobacterium seriolicida]|uniref:Pkd domain containing protein n=1 Tax=Ichthyobacterium seriolicida TaxID=242600 RepID=A0A1J1EAW6_9FLAO|nr:hypothetical protein [Ichthyobacterium seriolicida]BAV95083.1 pkd domain containing protein [Ichthyobacterium seriolicida]
MFKKNYFIKSIIFSFVLLSVIIFSCDKKNIIEDDLNICIESFALLDSENDQKNLGSDIKCDIDAENYTISLIVPSSAELRGLKFNITPCEGVSISPASGEETDFELVEKPSGESTEEASEASSEGSSSKRYKKIFTLTKGEKSQDYTVYITKEAAPKLTGFTITANTGKGIKTDVSAVITDDTDTATGKILLKIPYTGTTINLEGLSSVINVPEGCTIDPIAGTIAEDIITKQFTLIKTDTGSQRVYTVEVVKGPYIESFKFAAAASGRSSTNADITGEGVTGTIDHIAGTITVTVPSGVTLSSLTPTITVGDNTKAEFTPSAQIDFSSNVQYTVTSNDTSATDFTKVYTVTVTQNAEPQIATFIFTTSSPNNDKNLGSDNITGTITGNDIVLKVPYNAELNGLTPTITHASDVTIYKGDTGSTTPSTTPTDFSSSHSTAVKYRAVCATGGEKVYSVKVYKEPNVTGFSFTKDQNTDNSGFPTGKTYNGNVSGNNITITVANTVDVANLKASITGDNIAANYITPTTLNFSGNATVTVPNQYLPEYTKEYTVTVTKESAPVLSSFSINANPGKGIQSEVIAEFTHPSDSSNTGTILLKFPKNNEHTFDLTGLTYTSKPVTGHTLTPNSPLTDGGSIHSKTFTLTTSLGSKSIYTVTAIKGPYISKFEFAANSGSSGSVNTGISTAMSGNINHEANTITVTLPATVKKTSSDGNNKVTLTPTIELGGDGTTTVSPNTGVSQEFISGTPVNYTVTGQDGITKTYQVTVTRTKSTIAQITKFEIESGNSGNISETSTGDKGRIVVPVTTLPTSSTPTITQSEYATVTPADAQTFTSYDDSKEYTVTAENTSTQKTYDVYIYDSSKTIAVGDSLKLKKDDSSEISGTSVSIDASTRIINITTPSDTDLSSLKLVLEDTSGLSIEPTNPQDFSAGEEVKYTLKNSGTIVGHYWVKITTS